APPPYIQIPPTAGQILMNLPTNQTATATSYGEPSRDAVQRRHRHHHSVTETRTATFAPRTEENARSQIDLRPLTGPLPPVMTETSGLRPVSNAERLPSMQAAFISGLASQPESPMTPRPQGAARSSRAVNRQSIRHQRSVSGGSDSGNGEVLPGDSDESTGPPSTVTTDVEILQVGGQDGMLDESV